ncbi:hypothetical protein QBC38DRAFT_208030 [Podospora fimiseda]|uniref:Single-strand DNA deaminase toxin A-like C-terminal domain-containing protein n=1 Tax=Podospora fimiseda TaxID=252190 RepID=A0AAN7BNW9_9PEZI|nr:hypothetical protein QBC38DRAFT_208030 [Podospora fimiseda]
MADSPTLQPSDPRTPTPSHEEPSDAGESARKQNKFLPATIAVCWNSAIVKVLCPFCEEIHEHRINHFAHDPDTGDRIRDGKGLCKYDGPSPTRLENRVSHCRRRDTKTMNSNPIYTILFPFEENSRVAKLSFEVDKKQKGFNTVGLGIKYRDLWDTEKEGELPEAMENLSLGDGDDNAHAAKSLDVDGMRKEFTQPEREWIIWAACTGGVKGDKGLKECLEPSPHPSTLLEFRNEEGESLLGIAARYGYVEVVEYLLERGCDVNVTDDKGRTPLMEAALWGFPDIVKVLLRAGANKFLKDQQGLTAGDLWNESGRNKTERSNRERTSKFRGKWPSQLIPKGIRYKIHDLLDKCLSLRAVLLGPVRGLQDEHFHKSETVGTISLFLPYHQDGHSHKSETAGTTSPFRPSHVVRVYMRYDITDKTEKTVAILFRNKFPLFPAVAVSGWRGDKKEEFHPPENKLVQLNRAYWALEARNVARDIRFEFEEHCFDDYKGSYFSSHAEAQLMAFSVRKNYMFPLYNDKGVEDDLYQLFKLQPRNTAAEIVVTKKPCDSCKAFRDAIWEKIEIDFSIRQLDVKTESPWDHLGDYVNLTS